MSQLYKKRNSKTNEGVCYGLRLIGIVQCLFFVYTCF